MPSPTGRTCLSHLFDEERVGGTDREVGGSRPLDADAALGGPDERVGDWSFECNPLATIVENERRIAFAPDDVQHAAQHDGGDHRCPKTG